MIRVAFLDFWESFNDTENFFLDALSYVRTGIRVDEPKNADIIFCSLFGNKHNEYRNKVPIIQFIGEPIPPPLVDDIIYLSFSYGDYNSRNFRLPLWLLQFDWFGKGSAYGNPNYLIPKYSLYRNRDIGDRRHLCVSIFNHDPAGNRILFLQSLAESGVPLHAYGKLFSNWFFGESRKLEILSQYTFAHCFENCLMPGYHTEKLIHAYYAGCIPVYWGSDTLHLEFNASAMLLLDHSKSAKQLVNEILEINNDRKKMRLLLEQSLFKRTPCLSDVLLPIMKSLDRYSL